MTSYRSPLLALTADLREPERVEQMVGETLERFGTIVVDGGADAWGIGEPPPPVETAARPATSSPAPTGPTS